MQYITFSYMKEVRPAAKYSLQPDFITTNRACMAGKNLMRWKVKQNKLLDNVISILDLLNLSRIKPQALVK